MSKCKAKCECLEQARLLGMGAERELRLEAMVRSLEITIARGMENTARMLDERDAENDKLRAALEEISKYTESVWTGSDMPSVEAEIAQRAIKGTRHEKT